MQPVSLFAAGSNAQGQLANTTLDDAHFFQSCSFADVSPGKMPSGTTRVLDIACGANHTLLLLQRHDQRDSDASETSLVTEIWGCGDGRRGQLGPSYYMDTYEQSRDVASEQSARGAVFRPLKLDISTLYPGGWSKLYQYKAIAACWETSYVVLGCDGSSDILVSFGADDSGDLGIGNRKQHVVGALHRLDLTEMVTDDGRTLIIPGDNITIHTLAAGTHHVVVSFSATPSAPGHNRGASTALLCGWGASRAGQLGAHIQSSLKILPTPGLLAISEAVSDLALGHTHTILLTACGKLVGLGSNKKGELRGLDTLENVREVGCTWHGTYALTINGEVWATGDGRRGQLGRHNSSAPGLARAELRNRARALACGSEHVLALDETRKAVWGWGWSEHGNLALGVGRTEDVHLPTKIWPVDSGDRGPGTDEQVLGIWAGCGTSWIAVAPQ